MWLPTFHIQMASHALNRGGIIAYPTESVFGLGCDPSNQEALSQLIHLKSRSPSKGLILIASNIGQLEPWVNFDAIDNMEPLINSWPGPETWIVPKKVHVSSLLSGEFDSLAVRVSAHPIVSSLCDYFKGAIVSTSANLSGYSEATDLSTVRKTFSDNIDYYLPGELVGSDKPTRIRDALTGRIIRS